ncbi:MAG: NAD-dependent epimerase/dehydratase family protein [Candidatus Aenigmatarchaeota archaeon]
MKVLITGGAGFIGYHLSKMLVENGHEVIVYDEYLDFIDPEKSLHSKYLKIRLDWLKENTKLIRGDIRHKIEFFKTLQENQPDVIVHLAALPISTTSNEFPEDAVGINLNGTINVLDSIKLVPSVKKFVYASSSMVYGNFVKPMADEDHPTSPLDVYGATKLSCEHLTRAYHKQYGINYVIIRPSAVYGPTDCNRRVSQIFIENMMAGKPLTLHNGGESKLDFTYVEDIAQGFYLAATTDKGNGQTFNITRGEGRSLKEFVEILKPLIGKDVQIEYKPADMKRPERGTLDITRAKTILGYEPKYSLEEGLEKYVKFIKEHVEV